MSRRSWRVDGRLIDHMLGFVHDMKHSQLLCTISRAIMSSFVYFHLRLAERARTPYHVLPLLTTRISYFPGSIRFADTGFTLDGPCTRFHVSMSLLGSNSNRMRNA